MPNSSIPAAILDDSELQAVYIESPEIIPQEPLPKIIQRILKLFDGERTVSEVCQAAQISETKGCAVVKKLSAMGIIKPVITTPTSTNLELENSETLLLVPHLETSVFSSDEEAFFASEIASIDECDEPVQTLSEKINLFFYQFVRRCQRGSKVIYRGGH